MSKETELLKKISKIERDVAQILRILKQPPVTLKPSGKSSSKPSKPVKKHGDALLPAQRRKKGSELLGPWS